MEVAIFLCQNPVFVFCSLKELTNLVWGSNPGHGLGSEGPWLKNFQHDP